MSTMPQDLLQRVRRSFISAHGRAPQVVVRAPGRVNLMGEHTDYNGGFVLPCAIDFQTLVAATARDDGTVHVVAADYDDASDSFRLDVPLAPRSDAPWANYVRGVVQALQRRGFRLRGAALAIAGDIPQGAGLSSSASLQVAIGQAFKSMQKLEALDPTALALVAQASENDFVGCHCGIMDPLASARGVAGHALLIDCRSLTVTPVRLPPDLAVVIVHSGVTRELADSQYNRRREQCEEAARHYGVAALRDLDLRTLVNRAEGLDPVAFRRARHVVTENRRTQEACLALAEGDLQHLCELMATSHASMREDFEITVPAIDRLVEIAQTAIGRKGGARMTGGGFGGCVVALLPRESVPTLRAAIRTAYEAPGGTPALFWVCQAQDGAGVVAGADRLPKGSEPGSGQRQPV